MTILPDLEQQLVDLVTRTYAANRHHRERSSLRRAIRALPAAIVPASAVALTVAIALAAVLLLRPALHHPAASAAGNTEASLIAQYAVLRRPQTAADRTEAGPAPRLGGTSNFGGGQGPSPGVETLHYSVHVTGLGRLVDLPALTRVVSVGGVRVSLFVVHGVPSHTLPKATVTGNDPKDAASLVTPQALRKLQRRSNAGAGYYLIARIGRAGGVRVIEGPGTNLTTARARRFAAQGAGLRGVDSSSLSGRHGTIVAVVPDGIAESHGAGRASSTARPSPTSRRRRPPHPSRTTSPSPPLPLGSRKARRSAPKRSSVMRLTEACARASPTKATPRPCAEHDLQRQAPGPETAQSRRAERDPATPNRIVIIPTTVTLRSIRFGPGLSSSSKPCSTTASTSCAWPAAPAQAASSPIQDSQTGPATART